MAEVTGSSPVPPTMVRSDVLAGARPSLLEDLRLKELLITLLGDEGRRRLQLRQLTNDRLFQLYDSDLVLRVHNGRNLATIRALLAGFQDYLGGFPPSPELAKGFLAQYADRKPNTRYSYAMTIRSFMRWYGEDMADFKLRRPKTMPPYIEVNDIDRLYDALGQKQTHRGIIARDQLLVYLARRSGLRRVELANLEVRRCHDDWIEVRGGKGGKDRTVPLGNGISQRLQAFIAGKEPGEKVFGLKDWTISEKIRRFAKKAGVPIRWHGLRHYCATALLERGANPEAVRQLLGHENLETIQQYVALARGAMRDVAELLEDDAKTSGDGHHGDTIPTYPQAPIATGERPLMSWEIAELTRRSADLARRTSY